MYNKANNLISNLTKMSMKKIFGGMFAVAVLLLGMSACSDNTDAPSQQEMEKDLVGLWYEEFEYEDVTENGKPFNRAMIAMEAKPTTLATLHWLCLTTSSTNRSRYTAARMMCHSHGR